MSQEQEQELDIKIFEFADQVKDYFQNKQDADTVNTVEND